MDGTGLSRAGGYYRNHFHQRVHNSILSASISGENLHGVNECSVHRAWSVNQVQATTHGQTAREASSVGGQEVSMNSTAPFRTRVTRANIVGGMADRATLISKISKNQI